MSNAAPFVVKRLAIPWAHPEKPRRVSPAFHAYSLENALEYARMVMTSDLPFWVRQRPVWIERIGQSATRRRH